MKLHKWKEEKLKVKLHEAPKFKRRLFNPHTTYTAYKRHLHEFHLTTFYIRFST